MGQQDLCNPDYEAASSIYVSGNIHSLARPSAASGSETAMVVVLPGTAVMGGKVQSTRPTLASPPLRPNTRPRQCASTSSTMPV